MLKLRVIPCLDVKDGRVVKGVNFVSLRDAGDPVEQAIVYDAAGADELTFLDITASVENRDTIYDVVRRTAERVFLPLTVGGGVRAPEDMRRLLLAGADKCAVNSAAVVNPDLINQSSNRFGSQCVVVAIDARSDGKGCWEVYTKGGRQRRVSMQSPGRRRRRSVVRERSYSPAWIVTVLVRGSTSICSRPFAEKLPFRLSPRAALARWSIS